METLTLLQITWFFLIGFFLAGYSVLDGFDLGIGCLAPFLGKDERDTKALFTAIGPVWDGNEVWLITGGAALFAAFPGAYATVFSGFYLAIMVAVFALIFRAVSIEFWSLDEKNRKIWKWCFAAGSFIPSLLFGVALGNVITGIPMDNAFNFTGSFLTLLRPFPLITGLLGLTAVLMQGATYALVKTERDLQKKVRRTALKLWFFYAGFFLLSMVFALKFNYDKMKNIFSWIFFFDTALLLGINLHALKINNDRAAFITSSLAFLCLWGIAGSVLFPALVHSDGASAGITIYNASSSLTTLKAMTIIALIGMPVVIAYTVFVYKIFKGKVKI